jgi:hypothetical protein
MEIKIDSERKAKMAQRNHPNLAQRKYLNIMEDISTIVIIPLVLQNIL